MTPPVPSKWTAVIPAAGKGTRIGFDLPKILFPVQSKTILDHLLDEVTPSCQNITLVVSPSGLGPITSHIENLQKNQMFTGIQFRFQIQNQPIGMADAVFCGLKDVETDQLVVIWGDQIGLKRETLQACQKLHLFENSAQLTLPTVAKEDSYIHLLRNSDGQLTKVLQKREGEPIPKDAESDCGMFVFKTSAIKNIIQNPKTLEASIGAVTKEQNLLQMLPFFFDPKDPGAIRTLKAGSLKETLGINTREDARTFELDHLK